MTSIGPLYRPFNQLVEITIKGRQYSVPDSNMLLRALQYLAPETVSYGRFCWNEDCQYCRVTWDMGEGTPTHVALSCKLMVRDGMRVVDMAQEIRYCLRTLPSESSTAANGEEQSGSQEGN